MSAVFRTVALLCLVPTLLMAQQKPRMTGLTAGINFATLRGEDTDGAATDGRVGIAVGIFGSFQVSEKMAFQPEVIFIQKGADFTTTGTSAAAIRLDYVQIPALLRFRFVTGDGRTVPFVTLGPSIAFRIGCDAGVNTGGGFVSQGCDALTTSSVATTDFSAIAGAGVERGNLVLSVRYDYSLSSLHLTSDSDQIYNRGFAIMAAFGFRSW